MFSIGFYDAVHVFSKQVVLKIIIMRKQLNLYKGHWPFSVIDLNNVCSALTERRQSRLKDLITNYVC